MVNQLDSDELVEPHVRGTCNAGSVEPQSALLVVIPEVEPLVGRLRAELDEHAALGVPAHITIMAPFLPPATIDDDVHAALREITGAVPAFDVRFEELGWFRDDVFWLAPEPTDPFIALTEAVRERFGLEPYQGEHGTEIVPHLTVGYRGPVERLRAAAAEVRRGLPTTAPVRGMRLLTGTTDLASWTTVAEFSLTG
jgi:2'-5' RNA ligase